jgi:hypothetical protein
MGVQWDSTSHLEGSSMSQKRSAAFYIINESGKPVLFSKYN